MLMNEKSRECAMPPSPASRERVGVRDYPALAVSAVVHRRSTLRSRILRQEQTSAEKKMWGILKDRKLLGLKFRRQHPVGSYYADFACLESRVIIEIDGGQHCESKKDEARTKFLNAQGFHVLRFWNNDVMDNVDGVVQSLTLTLSQHALGEGTKIMKGTRAHG